MLSKSIRRHGWTKCGATLHARVVRGKTRLSFTLQLSYRLFAVGRPAVHRELHSCRDGQQRSQPYRRDRQRNGHEEDGEGEIPAGAYRQSGTLTRLLRGLCRRLALQLVLK